MSDKIPGGGKSWSNDAAGKKLPTNEPEVALHGDVVDDVDDHVGHEDEEEVARDAAAAAPHGERDDDGDVDDDHGHRQRELVAALGAECLQVPVRPHRTEDALDGGPGGGLFEMSGEL